jgi:hypothetical protein
LWHIGECQGKAEGQAVFQTLNYASFSDAQDDVEVRHEIIEGCQSSSCLWLDNGSIELWAGKLSNRLY